jgi:hypothetical protein
MPCTALSCGIPLRSRIAGQLADEEVTPASGLDVDAVGSYIDADEQR